LIILFATLGTCLSILINGWIVRTSLRPLAELRQAADRIQAGKADLNPFYLKDSDPDIANLSTALNSLVNQLEKRNRQLRALSVRVINAQEEERKRIALSLHDDTGQALSMLIINLERLENRLPSSETEIKKKLAASRQLAVHALGELRKIVRDLRPSMLDTLGLVPAIRSYARSNLEEAGIRVQIEAPEAVEQLPHPVTLALFRIAQEAINNIVRHSQAKSVLIRLSQEKDAACLIIQDDGRGFDVEQVGAHALIKQQWGLVGIRERADLVSGQVQIESQPGCGTRISAYVPYPAD
jgi:two-component system sensor histidine kinase DegS